MGFFDKIKQGFKKTSDAVSHSLDSVFAAFVKIDEDLLEELEEALILSDVGASTSAKIVARWKSVQSCARQQRPPSCATCCARR